MERVIEVFDNCFFGFLSCLCQGASSCAVIENLGEFSGCIKRCTDTPVAEVKTPTFSSHSSNVGFGKWVTGSRGSQAQDMEKNLLFALSNQVLQQNSRY